MSSYDLIVIGAGIGGYPAAIRGAQLGARVLIVEKAEVGGTCLNRGCIPTKALKATAEMLDGLRRLDEFGLSGRVDARPDMRTIMQRKNRIVSELVSGIRFLLKSHGVALKSGSVAFLSRNKIQITAHDGTREVAESKGFIIATGSSPAELPGIRPDGRFILTSDQILDIDTLPKRLIIIGAGVVGTEMAFIFRSMGVDVTVLELMPRPLPSEDEEISKVISRSFKKTGIRLVTHAGVTHTEIKDGVDVYLENKEVVTGDMVLVSVGRKINTDGIGLEGIGVRLGRRHEVVVDPFLNTGVDNIYACGDVIGGMMLAHVAYKEGITAVANLLGREKRSINYRAIPNAIYSKPEAASVGFTEEKALSMGLKIKVGTFPYRALGKARAFSEMDGEVKVIVDSGTEKVLGMHIVGPHATDIIAQGAMAIQNDLTVRALADTVAAHPTYSEAVMEAAEDVFSIAIHQPRVSADRSGGD
ncbi:MAG: dihydrolipoyl dehydrogenase [Deltaproteobacteria bacterium]|nr:dihydrolipoyl dehydrogenase [Deltaproteobacteria bacterium]